MLAVLRSRLTPTGRQPHRTSHAMRPLMEALETRAVLSISITANIGGLTPPVESVTLPQPTGSGVQDVSLILRPSADDPQLFREGATGKILHAVTITLNDGKLGTDTITLTDAVIASYRLVPGPTRDQLAVALTLEGQIGREGSIAASINGVTPTVVSLTIPQPATSEAQEISLVVKETEGVRKLFTDAATGKVLRNVEITLNRLGNGSNETISLTNVLISSIEFVGADDTPEVQIALAAEQETILTSEAI